MDGLGLLGGGTTEAHDGVGHKRQRDHGEDKNQEQRGILLRGRHGCCCCDLRLRSPTASDAAPQGFAGAGPDLAAGRREAGGSGGAAGRAARRDRGGEEARWRAVGRDRFWVPLAGTTDTEPWGRYGCVRAEEDKWVRRGAVWGAGPAKDEHEPAHYFLALRRTRAKIRQVGKKTEFFNHFAN